MALAAFSGGFWIEISPDVFLKGTVGEGGCLFDMEQSTIKDVIHPSNVTSADQLFSSSHSLYPK